jgi:ribose 5-phosphate isomerase A
MGSVEEKRAAAAAAVEFVAAGEILGVGTGSTVEAFIDLLAPIARDIPGAVSSSDATTGRLRALGIAVHDLNDVGSYPLYVDGADEFDPGLSLIKGGGAALTGEKIAAAAAERFVCIVDESKRVSVLGAFPLPVEVLPAARALVARELTALGGSPELRAGVLTDNGNPILDVHGLVIDDPRSLEIEIDSMPGVVSCGIFARRGADVVLMATPHGVERFERA